MKHAEFSPHRNTRLRSSMETHHSAGPRAYLSHHCHIPRSSNWKCGEKEKEGDFTVQLVDSWHLQTWNQF